MKRKKLKKIKESKLDEITSLYVRTQKNFTCERCGKHIEPPTNQIQCSHFHSRSLRSVRYELDNLDCLCSDCHWFFEKRKTTDYTDWKLKKLGKKRFEALKRKAYRSSEIKIGVLTQTEKQIILAKYKLTQLK